MSLEFSLVEKCHARFIKKISQLKSDIPSCRCKNFNLKVVSVRSDGGGRGRTPRTLPLDPPLCHHRPSLHHDLLRLLRNGTKLPISPEEDHPSQNTIDQNIVRSDRCIISLHVVLCGNAFSFSTVSVKGGEKKTHSCCSCPVLCVCTLSRCPSSVQNISFPAFFVSEDSSQRFISH